MTPARPRKSRIVIADDHALVRSGVVALLASTPDFVVAAECADADEAVSAALRTHPDILLMDIDMPGVSSFDAVRTIRSHCPAVRAVFLSGHAHDRHIERALRLDAAGFLTKMDPADVLLAALRAIAAGKTYYSDRVLGRIVLDEQGPRLASEGRTRISTLSDREVEVLTLVASGMSKKEIAAGLRLSVSTVDKHCTNFMNKLDIHDRVAIAKFAIREGIIVA